METTVFDRMFRRIQMMFGRGRVTLVDDSGTVQKMQVQMSAMETSDARYRLAEFGFSSNPPVGSDILALHVTGDRAGGAVFATNHQPSRPKGLKSGESMLYSQDGKQVYMTASGGIVVEAKGQDVTVNDAANVTWNCSGDFTLKCGGKFNVEAPGGTNIDSPTVAATGDVQDNSGSNSTTMKTMRQIYDQHTHSGTDSDGDSFTTQPPNQTE